MIKYKLTLLSGLTIEMIAPNMSEAVTHAEKWYNAHIVKCEIVDSTKEKREQENDERIEDVLMFGKL